MWTTSWRNCVLLVQLMSAAELELMNTVKLLTTNYVPTFLVLQKCKHGFVIALKSRLYNKLSSPVETAEQKYDWGGLAQEAAKQPIISEASACEGPELESPPSPLGSAALALLFCV